uniref:transmembrane protein 119b n=1 Tax=Centroberyx gerrardi TaxID=166262 RepID=UPI003AAB8562
MILWEMMLLMALHPIGLSLVFCISSSLATPLPLQVSLEGSADGEEPSNLAPSPSTPATGGLSSEYQTTPGGHSHLDTVFLNQLVNFLQKNLLFILVGATLLLVIFLIICGAVFMSRRRKVNAYYPSSFPSKMYVDQRDKTGGAKPFNEVPEKAPRGQEPEPVDSRKQLQADIMRAAKSLRTANKSPDVGEGNDPCEKIAEDSPKPDASTVDKELSNLLEQKEVCPPPDSEAAAAASGPERPLTPPEQEGSSGPGPSQAQQAQQDHRPSSQHVHSDSAPLQLITGEKTAF